MDQQLKEIIAEQREIGNFWYRGYRVGSGTGFYHYEGKMYLWTNFGKYVGRSWEAKFVFDIRRDISKLHPEPAHRDAWMEGFMAGMLAGKKRLDAAA